MPRFPTILGSLGQALCEKGRLALSGSAPFGDALLEVARAAHHYLTTQLTELELRVGLQAGVRATPEEVAGTVTGVVNGLAAVQSIPFREELTEYLQAFPVAVRQVLRRPNDAEGRTVPEKLTFERPEDLLPFLPPRLPYLRPDEKIDGIDEWRLCELWGFGGVGEVWRAKSTAEVPASPVALKFVTDRALKEDFAAHEADFRRVLDLEGLSGFVPLRAVYLRTDPPCMEWEFVSGYDLAGLMRDWMWRYDEPKPDQAARVVKRVAEIVGALHRLDPPVVHRDLKPANVMVHPTAEGRVTIWVADLGWGAISAAHALSEARHAPKRGDLLRQTLRGAHSPLYASPQQAKGDKPDPRDDVHALGVIWYQLLARDPHAAAPVGNEWAGEFRDAGLSDGLARLLAACLATRPDRRPADGLVLAEQIAANLGTVAEGSKSFTLRGTTTNLRPLPAETPQGAEERQGDKETRRQGDKERKPGSSPRVPVGGASGTPAGGHGSRSDVPRLLRNSIDMTLALIPAGTFRMGSPEGEHGRREGEGPVHEVRITRPFYLSVHPVTQEQFQRVMGRNPSHFTKAPGGPDHPVESVTWQEAVAFCDRLTALPAEADLCRLYRLPTEAEWEYACRAGTTTAYYFGDTITPKQAHYMALEPGGWKRSGGAAVTTCKVGSSPINGFLLHDMHGNVLEWCQDWFDEYYYFESPAEDPPGPAAGQLKVVRGGCFGALAADCRSAARKGQAPDTRSNTVGFRVALTVFGET